MDLPSGTVTFLFTDIEGSTRLWERDPGAMGKTLVRHDEILRDAVERNGGYVFKTIGDAFCAAFPTASEALAAAVEGQCGLASEDLSVPISVRMALHTGVAEVRDGDYFGQPLNRVARLLAAGHGGQVLLSLATQELTRDALPGLTRLRVLGEHRLRDLSRPETVFQVVHPDLRDEFPPLNSLDYLPNNLPRQLTSFIGREKEIGEVAALVRAGSLVTLTGTGGCGKTRLALQVAADLMDQFPDGVWLAELAPLADPDLVPQTVARVLGLIEHAKKSYSELLVEHLYTKRALLVLDNCEHLVSACAELAAELLRACPTVKLLTSSREALGILGEQTYRVPSLSSPDPKGPIAPERLGQFEAVRLFIDRALLQRADFAITNSNAPAVASICHRLDGIPLALELAAARVKSLSVEEIHARLENRFRLLSGGSRTALPRQQTLKALIDWSYDLLSGEEKILLARLSVFAGGWTLDAADRVGAGGSIADHNVMDLLTGLVDKSLVLADMRAESTRYGLLETMRQYARDRLIESGEAETRQTIHLRYFLELAEQAELHLRGPDQQNWFVRLEAEHDNLRSAMAWATEGEEDWEIGLRMCGTLGRFWYVRSHFGEGLSWCRRALDYHPGAHQKGPRAKALSSAAALAMFQGDYGASRQLWQESLALRRATGDQGSAAGLLMNLGSVDRREGNHVGAMSLYEESLAIHREMANRSEIANTLANMAVTLFELGEFDRSRICTEEALGLAREIGNTHLVGIALLGLGAVAIELGDNTSAEASLTEGIYLQRQLGDRAGVLNSLDLFSKLALAKSDAVGAVRLMGASDSLGESIGYSRSSFDAIQRANREAAARARLGGSLFETAYGEGRAWAMEEAIGHAVGEFP